MTDIYPSNIRQKMQISFNQFIESLLSNISSAVTLKKYTNSFVRNVRIWDL